jgi:hypothetical protein
MKFKITKKWCKQAAEAEKGYTVAAGKLTKEQKDFIQGKIRKVPGLSKVVQEQKRFIEQVNLSLIFLQAYEGNPDSFKLLIGDDVWEHYRFEECFVANNAEWMWESIDEMTCDIVYKNKNFTVTGNGIFVSLHFSKKKNDKKFKENFKYLLQYGEGGEWHI